MAAIPACEGFQVGNASWGLSEFSGSVVARVPDAHPQ